VNADPEKYDLIFMDIIMPVFDGVSATACIRVAAARVPIVAMTSNIRGEDIATYFQWGMNDVLAKPFTTDGMVRILRKHLTHMFRDPLPPGSSGDDMIPSSGGAGPAGMTHGYGNQQAGMGMGPMGGPPGMAGAGGQVKFETTPIQSPATTSSWHSPGQGQPPHISPTMEGGVYMAGTINGGQAMGAQRAAFHGGPQPPMGNPPTRGIPEIMAGDDRPEKRRRLYGPGQAQYPQ